MERPARTAETLRKAAETKLIPGKKVRIETLVKAKDYTLVPSKEKQIRKGEVISLYPFHFTVKVNNYVECFRYNELFGNEEVRVRA